MTSEEDDKKVTICVQDFGKGIPKKSQALVFGRFYRGAANRKEKISGLGLGLYLSSQIIKRHKGEIWLKSIWGKGSTFCFSLPVAKR